MARRGLVFVLLLSCWEQLLTTQYSGVSSAIVQNSPNKSPVVYAYDIRTKHLANKRQTSAKRDTSFAHLPRPSTNDLDASVTFARDVVSRLVRLESNLAGADVNVKQGTPAHGQLIDSYPCAQALLHGKDALIAVKASLYLAHNHCRRYGLDEDHCAKFISTVPMNSTSLSGKCKSPLGNVPSCASNIYRSYDGSCNHQLHPAEGQALTGYKRLIGADYGDSIQQPRENSKGKALPSARVISTYLAHDRNQIEEDKTLALMQWSQFVEHDMAHTPVSKMSNSGSSISCCKPDGGQLKPRYIHPSCMPVVIPRNDPFYASKYIQCMNYVRSVPAIRKDCTFGPTEQMNQATHFLDGSMIYGTTRKMAQSLRQFTDGRLADSSREGRAFLPSADQPTNECQVTSDSTTCYKSGDVRVNAHPHMTVMYTVWHREHNRIASLLARLNPQWDDDRVYQNARRIVIAEIQHVTYNEWLPVVLGQKFARKLGLFVGQPKSDHGTNFDESVDPAVTNSFSTAALRFVHSMMQSRLRLYNEDRGQKVNGTLLLREHFNRPRIVEQPEHLDALIRGLTTQNCQKSDMDYVEDITSLLYKDSNSYGLDIVSLDVQRGRDHGLPGYNKYRQLCGLPIATTFDQFKDVVPSSTVGKLRSVYSHPDDVDLLIGGMSEQPVNDSLLGVTFRCILGEQFLRTKLGDRYFYDVKNQPHSFTQEQLRAIKKITLARIFCDNGDDIRSMQPNVFRKPSESNSLVECQDANSIPSLDLNLWKEANLTS